jgi:predicted DNA-binding protein (MmcQ/YjbR family)
VTKAASRKAVSKTTRARATLRKLALGYPEAKEDFPWGERVVKVRKKVFVFMGTDGDFGMSVKLPGSGTMALMLPFATPTGYGLGKSGWVSVHFERHQSPPIDLLAEWIDESYRAVAPKTLVARLGGKAPPTPTSKPAARSPGGARRPPRR